MRKTLLAAVAAVALATSAPAWAYGPLGENPVEAGNRLYQITMGVGRPTEAGAIVFWASKLVERGVPYSTVTDITAVFVRDHTLTLFDIAQLLSVFPAFPVTIGYPLNMLPRP